MTLEVEGKVVNTDEQGNLLDPNDWDDCVAEAIAGAQGLELTETHWGLVNYFRSHYEDHMRHPSMHELVKTLGRHHGKRFEEAQKYRDFLYKLFPQGPVPTLCKLASLPKPVGEIED